MHIKTHLCICLAFLSGLPVLANGKGGFVDGIFRYSVQENVIVSTGDSTVVLTCADRSAITSPLPIPGTLVIPATVVHDGYEYQVAEIADTAFVRCGNIESIVISEGIGSIGSHAFYRCPRLRSVSIPSTVFYIGDNAFGQCPELQEIKVDAGNEAYDSRNGCNAIIETATGTLVQGCATTRIPRDVTTIGEQAFAAIPLPSSFVIPEGVRSIAPKAFLGSPTLECVAIPASVDSVGALAFSSCPWLWSVTWKGPTAHIGSSAFSDCRYLDLVEIPEGTRSIGDHAFANCESLQYVSLPHSLEQLSRSAFKDSPCDETVQAQQQDILCNRVQP